MKYMLVFYMLIGLLSCNEQYKDTTQVIEHGSVLEVNENVVVDTVDYYKQLNFTGENGMDIRYFCEGGDLFIEFGNNDFKKIMKDTFPCAVPSYSIIPTLWAEGNQRTLLGFGCGAPCWGLYDLPQNPKDTVRQFMYQYAYDKERDILIYIDYSGDEDRLIAKNLSTNEYDIINVDSGNGFLGNYIDSIDFKNGELFLQLKTQADLQQGFDTKGSQIIKRKIRL